MLSILICYQTVKKALLVTFSIELKVEMLLHKSYRNLGLPVLTGNYLGI